MPEVYIALGSNLGDRETYLIRAIRMLQEKEGFTLRGLSGVYETAPVGYTQQASFLNMVCRGAVSLDPLALLEALLEIEDLLERKRLIHWGPRTMDLDLLLYGDEKITTPQLTLPHPRMGERAFVLVPLRDVYGSDRLGGHTFTERLESCPDREGIRLYRSSQSMETLVKSDIFTKEAELWQ